MSEENVKPDALAVAGASKEDIDAGQSFEGAPKPPADGGNEPPKKEDKKKLEGIEETFNDDDNKEPAKEEPAKEEPKDTGPVKEFVKIGDPAYDAVIDVLKDSGVSAQEANDMFAKAANSGELKDIDWNAIEAKIGSAKTFLVKSGVEAFYNNKQTAINETVRQTHEIFGGEQNWNKVKAWAQAKEAGDGSFKKKVDSIRALLNEGGQRAEIGARELLRLYNTDGGTKGLNATKLVQGTATGNVIGTPLTRADYINELKQAHDRNAKPHEIKAINERRYAGIKAGI